MTNSLDKRMRRALEILRFECDYEDHHKGGSENFILRNVLSPGIGDTTISRLLEMGLIVQGPHRWRDGETGYRITRAGRDALKVENAQEPQKPRSKLSSLSPRLKPRKPRF